MRELSCDVANRAVDQELVSDLVRLSRRSQAFVQRIDALVFEIESEIELLVFCYREPFEDVVSGIEEFGVLPKGFYFDNPLTLIERGIGRVNELAATESSFKAEALGVIASDYS